MSLYHLVNKEGNAHTLTEDKQKRDRLVRGGFIDLTEQKAAKAAAVKAAKETAKAEKDAKASGGASK